MVNCGWFVNSCVTILPNISGTRKYGTAGKFAFTDCIVHAGLSRSFGSFKILSVLMAKQKSHRLYKSKKSKDFKLVRCLLIRRILHTGDVGLETIFLRSWSWSRTWGDGHGLGLDMVRYWSRAFKVGLETEHF